MIGCSLFGAVLYIIGKNVPWYRFFHKHRLKSLFAGEIMNKLIWGNPSLEEPSVSQSKQSKGKAKKPQKAE